MVSAKVNRDPTNCNVRNICIDLNIFLKYDLNNDYEVKGLKINSCLPIISIFQTKKYNFKNILIPKMFKFLKGCNYKI